MVASAGGAAWLLEGELFAPVPRLIGAAPLDLGARAVTFPSGSGSLIHGWFSRGRPGGGAVLLLHGVRGDRRDMLSRAEFLHRLGYAVLLIDFQAEGESPGTRITFGDLESRDAAAAINYLHQALPDERLGAIGVSMGAAALVLADPRPQLDAVVLESMYPTIAQALRDRLRHHFGVVGSLFTPLLMAQLPARVGTTADRLRPIDHIGSLEAPVLVVSGARDQHTPIDEARSLFSAATPPKSFWVVEGAAHVNLHRFAAAEYERRIDAFLAPYLKHSPGAAASP